ncbi:MAG TPA: hypothetical protein VK424_00590 [Thermoplasmata archaeon]|nr:hypothetical protein [Thermoplasmata archaeon]
MTHHEPVTTDHVEYASKDPSATRRFLEKVFGYHFDILADMGGYAMRSDEISKGSSTGVRVLEKGESSATIAFLTVPNLDEALKTAQREGARIVLPKTEIPPGWHAVVHAPGDLPIGLFQSK